MHSFKMNVQFLQIISMMLKLYKNASFKTVVRGNSVCILCLLPYIIYLITHSHAFYTFLHFFFFVYGTSFIFIITFIVQVYT